MNKCIFLDRDGVINKDRVDYVYKVEDLVVNEGVKEALELLKQNGYLLVVITNQSGIDKKIFTEDHVSKVHDEIQKQTGNHISEFYYSIIHRTISNSLSSKPGSLLFEKAISKYNIDPKNSWMIGDRLRDLIPADKLGISTVLIEADYDEVFDGKKSLSLLDAVKEHIL